MYSRYLISLLLLFGFSSLSAQQIYVNEVVFKGNKKTRIRALVQEMTLRETVLIQIQDIEKYIQRDEQQLLSTGLFNDVKINLINIDSELKHADVEVNLEENWYLFPVPIFELADRNFNVWWSEEDRDLSRLNYGVRINHYNFSGNRDPLKLKVQFGFIRKFEVKYSLPYVSKNNKWGLASTIFYSDNKTIAYATENNKTLWHRNVSEDILLRRFRIGPELKYRPNVNQFHALRLEFHHNRIDAYVVENLTTDYFLDGSTSLRMIFIEYDFQLDRRQYVLYPERGHLFFVNFKKEGIGLFNDVNNFNITLGAEHYTRIYKQLVFGNRIKLKTNTNRGRIAFANNTGLGWDDDIVSGYELYVMDGPDYLISRNYLRTRLFQRNMKTVHWVPGQFQKINIAIYLRFNYDLAIVNERNYLETNFLNNQIIYGYGPALDMILFNNFLFSFEYSFNDIGEHGLFFSNKVAF